MNLFVLGNGFDIAHGLPTEYNYFRDYLTRTYPGLEEYDDLVPESVTDNHGKERFDIDEIAGYVSRIMDGCNGGDWSNLEYYLGDAVFDCFLDDLEIVDIVLRLG